jgi:hypothetical protein
MKKIILALGLFSIFSVAKAQNGLERIVVEKFYVSDATDEANSVGRLPVGSVTYRVYVDMLPGYNFQMAYGDARHSLHIYSDSTFYNDEDRGKTTGSNTLANFRKATLMLDSYFSVGGVCAGKMGVLKTDDTDGALANTDGNLTNNDPEAGEALTVKDGMVTGTPKVVGFIGFDPAGGIFDATSDAGNSFNTNDGSWYILGGATGVDPNTNMVLIGQFTCKGDFGFDINVQIGTPGGGQQNYVHENVNLQPGEIFEPTCSYLNSTVSVENIQAENSIQVYPNPMHDNLTLVLNESAQNETSSYSIYSIDGKLLFQKNLGYTVQNQKEVIDVTMFSAGQYFIQVSNGNVVSTQKIVKVQ